MRLCMSLLHVLIVLKWPTSSFLFVFFSKSYIKEVVIMLLRKNLFKDIQYNENNLIKMG